MILVGRDGPVKQHRGEPSREKWMCQNSERQRGYADEAWRLSFATSEAPPTEGLTALEAGDPAAAG
jgi:hypothetical protein